jgi:RecB family exonuclease
MLSYQNPPTSQDTPTMLRLDGPPGSGKTHALAREAYRLSQQASTNVPVLILALTGSNVRRLHRALRLEKGSVSLPGAPIRIVQMERWLFSLLKQAPSTTSFTSVSTTTPTQKPDLLTNHEARLLLHEILQEVGGQARDTMRSVSYSAAPVPLDMLAYASRHPSLAHALWELFREWQAFGKTPADLFGETNLASLPVEDASQATRRFIQRIYNRFYEKTAGVGLYCRSDLANQVLARLEANASWVESLSASYSAILVDEAQELSASHHALLAALKLPLVLAGNVNLSVRSYRGAQSELFAGLSPYQTSGFSITETVLPPRPLNPPMAALPPCIANDPAEEAATVAEAIQNFVQSGQAIVQPGVQPGHGKPVERAARWDDCAVLLRSSRFKGELVAALQSRNIPVQGMGVSDNLLRLQHRVFDFFGILAAWEADALPVDVARDPAQLKAALVARTPVHPESGEPDADNAPAWQAPLDRWLDTDKPEHLAWLGSAYARYRSSGDWLPLWDELMAHLLSPELLDDLFGASLVVIPFIEHSNGFEEASPTALMEVEARQVLGNLQTQFIRLDALYRQAFSRPFPIQTVLAHADFLWQDALEDAETNEAASDGGMTESDEAPAGADSKAFSRRGVHLLSLHQAQGETFPFVSIPFIVTGEFPREILHTELLPPPSQRSPQVANAEAEAKAAAHRAEERRLLKLGLTRATSQLLLSAHRHQANDIVEPSPWVAWQHGNVINGKTVDALLSSDLRSSEDTASRLQSEKNRAAEAPVSAWAALDPQAPDVEQPLLGAEETLSLSASSIKAYMTCPRQYYYRNLLFLPQESGVAAVRGSLTHRVFELFNRTAQAGNHTVERFKALIEIMTAVDEDPDAFETAGFSPRDARQLMSLGPIGLWDFKAHLLASADDLERKGYFRRYVNLRQIEAEKKLRDVVVAGLGERCRLRGSVDALIETIDEVGKTGWDVLDYKTSNSAYGISLSGCQERFLEGLLAPLPGDPALSPPERFAGKMNPSYPADYQLPLYFLALRQDPRYRDSLRHFAMQMVRPVFPGKEEQGAIRLDVAADELAAVEAELVDELRRFVVEPILSDSTFAPTPSPSACDHCAYRGICDAVALGDEAEATEG